VREVFGEGEVGLRVAATRLGGGERDRAERAVARRHRHDHRRAQAELFDESQLLRLGVGGGEQRVGYLREDVRAPRADHFRHALARCRVDRRVAHSLPRPLDLRRVGVRDGDALDALVRLEIDDAPVGEVRDDEARD
jgi:hypothetical protein